MNRSHGWPATGCLAVLALVSFFVLGIFTTSSSSSEIPMAMGGIELGPDEVGVVFNTLTGEQRTLEPGTHTFTPGVEEITVYPTALQEYTMMGDLDDERLHGDIGVRALTKDGEEIVVGLTLIYRIDAAQVLTVHTRWGENYANDLIRPALRAATRAALAQSDAKTLFCGFNRADVVSTIETNVQQWFENEGFEVIELLYRDQRFSVEFTVAHETACGS